MKQNIFENKRAYFYSSLLLFLLCLSHNNIKAQCSTGINRTFAIVNSGSGNVYYDLDATTDNPDFSGYNFGSFCPSATLILNGGQNQVYKCNGGDIWQNQIWYRIYPTSASPSGAFTPITEYYQSGSANGCGGQDQTWEANGANINVLAGLSAGTYYLEVYSTADYQYCGTGTWYASNNSYNYRAQFTVNATPSITINRDTACAGHSGTITATGGASYLWSTGSTSASITDTAGTYTVTVTNSSGCTATASGTISNKANPTVTVNNPSICAGGTATLLATGGTSYLWSTDGTNDTITTSTAGTYTVTVTNAGGCTASASSTVTVNPNPTAYAGDDTFVNFVTNVTLGGSGSIGGTPPYTFAWTPSKGLSDSIAQFPICTPLATTKYYLTVTDSNGCKGKDSVIVSFNKGNNPLTDIVYSAQNLAFTDSGQYLEFDLFASDTPSNLLFSQGQIYLTYDTTYFGANLISSGAITVTKGQAIDSPYYNLSATDSTRNMMKLSITHTASPTSLVNLDSANQQLCHFKFRVASVGTPFAMFDSILMVGQSLYQRTATSLEFPYDLVQVRGLVGATQADAINAQLANISYTGSSQGYLTFDVQVQSSEAGTNGAPFYDADVTIAFNTYTFGTSPTLNCTSSSTTSISSNFDLTPSVSSSTIDISISANTSYDPSYADDGISSCPIPNISSYTTIATCSLTVANCCLPPTNTGPYVNITAVSGEYANMLINDNGDPQDTANDWTFYQSSANSYGTGGDKLPTGGYTNGGGSICPNSSSTPTITSLYAPDASQTITAGTYSVLTITGSGFGCSTGRVLFPNADTGGIGMMHTQTPDIQTWDDNKITVWVPSIQDGPAGSRPAGSGQIEVISSAGDTSNLSPDALTIPYAITNYRDASNNPIIGGFKNQDSMGGYRFTPDSLINPIALGTITRAMNDWNCQTGENFMMGSQASNQSATYNHINSIFFGTPGANLLALTIVSVALNINCTSGSIVVAPVQDIDMIISNTATFDQTDTPVPAAGKTSLLYAIRHEFGHASLLAHVDDMSDLMYYYEGVGITAPPISYNDESGVDYILTDIDPNYLASCFSTSIRTFSAGCLTNGINNVGSNPFSVSVYPNPFNESVTITTNLTENTQMKVNIFDVLGQLVESRDYGMRSGSVEEALNVSQLSAGLYVVQVAINNSSFQTKLVKK